MNHFPTTPAEALAVPNGTFLGGGTDWMPLMKLGLRDDRELVFLSRVAELRGIREEDGAVWIGAAVTLCELAEDALIRARFPALAESAAAVASPQIRNVATLGGNVLQDRRCIYFNQSRHWREALPLCFKTGGAVCHQIPNSPVCCALYYSDAATALLVYDAEAECLEDGAPCRIPLDELIRRHSAKNGLAPAGRSDLLVTGFRLPLPPEGERSGFYKYAMRASIDFPILNLALRRGGARGAKLVAGAVAPEPVVLTETAALIDGGADDQAVVAACGEELKRLAKPVREACIPPERKRELFRLLSELLRRLA